MAEFNVYRVYYYSAPQYNWDVRIDLYMNDTEVGTLLFMKEGQAIPANSNPGGLPRVHFSVRHFPAIMTMLKEEKPLYLSLNSANGIGTILTTDEPVGEEEGV
jgi:hypothetical protein